MQAPLAGKMERYYPNRGFPFFSSHNNISPKSKQVHDSFLSQNIFRNSKKIFCVRIELEKLKNEMGLHFFIWQASFLVLENKQEWRSFFLCPLCHVINHRPSHLGLKRTHRSLSVWVSRLSACQTEIYSTKNIPSYLQVR